MAARSGEMYRTPIPSREIEKRSSGSGPVVTYFLSQEELDRMREKEGPACGLTKQALIEAVAAGESLSSIERAWNMKYNTIHTWVKKWGLKGISADQAREMLDNPAPVDQTVSDHSNQTVGTREHEAALDFLKAQAEKDEEIERLRAEIKRLQAKIEHEYATAARVVQSEVDLNKHKDAEIESLKVELDCARSMFNEACDSIDKLQSQLNAVEAAHSVTDSDPVKHPTHTFGAVDCIDAIETATAGLTGGQAYNTGAAIKYLWRWSRKNGVEDLREAHWYIERLIAGLE